MQKNLPRRASALPRKMAALVLSAALLCEGISGANGCRRMDNNQLTGTAVAMSACKTKTA